MRGHPKTTCGPALINIRHNLALHKSCTTFGAIYRRCARHCGRRLEVTRDNRGTIEYKIPRKPWAAPYLLTWPYCRDWKNLTGTGLFVDYFVGLRLCPACSGFLVYHFLLRGRHCPSSRILSSRCSTMLISTCPLLGRARSSARGTGVSMYIRSRSLHTHPAFHTANPRMICTLIVVKANVAEIHDLPCWYLP